MAPILTSSYPLFLKALVQKTNCLSDSLGRFRFPPDYRRQGEDIVGDMRDLILTNAGSLLVTMLGLGGPLHVHEFLDLRPQYFDTALLHQIGTSLGIAAVTGER